MYLDLHNKRLLLHFGIELRQYQIGITSSSKNTEVKQLGQRVALVWVTIPGLNEDAVATNYSIIPGTEKRKPTIYYTVGMLLWQKR